MTMEFDYYYGSQADQFSFIRIPRALLKDDAFAPLSIPAKLLYGLLLDRMGLSMKNGWFDGKNRVYIIYQIAEIQEDLGLSKKKAMDYLNELEKFGLVEKKRRGLGLPSILYVKSFLIDRDFSRPDDEAEDTMETSGSDHFRTSVSDAGTDGTSRSADSGTSADDSDVCGIAGSAPTDTSEMRNEEENDTNETVPTTETGETAGIPAVQQAVFRPVRETGRPLSGGNHPEISRSVETGTSRSAEMGTSRGAEMGTSRGADMGTSRGAEIAPQEVPEREPLKNYININYNNISKTDRSNRIQSANSTAECDSMADWIRARIQLIEKNIGFQNLLNKYHHEQELVQGIRDLILEVVLTRSDTVLIASDQYPAELVRMKFLKLDYSHIEYVIDCFLSNTTRVKNIKKYLLAALFNAPSTISGYYTAEAHHDMPYLVEKRRQSI